MANDFTVGMAAGGIVGTFATGLLVAAAAIAQPAPTQAPDVRALQAEVSELTQAWTGARTQMFAAQDQIKELQGELDRTKAELAALQAKDAKAIQPPQVPTHSMVAPTSPPK